MMGAGNALLVSNHWARLPANPFKVLNRMALVILDGDPKPRWFGGDGPLLEALGRVEFGDEEKARHAADVTLRKAIGILLANGALEYKIRPMKGLRAEYWCHWMPQEKLAAYARKSCEIRKEGLQTPQGNLVPKEEGGGEMNRQKERSPLATTSPAPVDTRESPIPIQVSNTNPTGWDPDDPDRCPHGDNIAWTRYGEPACPLCRAALTKATT